MALSGALICVPGRLLAQSDPEMTDEQIETLPVFSRPHAEYDPWWIHVGAFQVVPSLQLSEQFNSNLYALPSHEIGDFSTVISPSLSINTDWNRNYVGLSGSANILRQAHRVSENVTNSQVSLTGRWDSLEDSALQSVTGYQIQHEARGAPDAVNGRTPTRFDLTTENLSYSWPGTSLGMRWDFTLIDYRFHNVLSQAGQTIDQTYRNRTEYTLAPTISYTITPTYQVYTTLTGNSRNYHTRTDPSGFDRNSNGYQILAGTAVDLTGILYGTFYIGYQSEFYRDPRLSTAAGLAFGGNLLWNPTRITSVTLKASRTVSETTLTGASSALETDLAIEVQHELRRNLLARASASYSRLDYQGSYGTNNFTSVSSELRYLVNEYVSVGATAQYNVQPAGANTTGFNQAVFGLQLTGRF